MSCTRTGASSRGLRVALGAFALVVAFGGAAEARVETLRWSHSSAADVDGFKLHYGSSPGSYTTTVDVGRPAPTSGVFSYNLTVADTATVYVVMTAYGSGFLESNYSSAKTLAPTTTPPPPPPPPSGAAWTQDFQTTATGTYVAGWYDSGADNSSTENDGLFRVSDMSGNRVLTTSSSLVNIHSHYVSSGADQWTSYELRGRMRLADTAGGVGVTAYSQYPQSDVYYRLRSYSGKAFEMAPHPDGADIGCSPTTTGVVPKEDTWYRFRFKVSPSAGANSIQAKVWADGSTEPSSWQTTCTDARSNRPQKGSVGVWHKGPGSSFWDELAVYFNGSSTGSPPPPPILIPLD